jgi:glycosyltransferase involved in cell wall biosynthesis
MIFCVFTPAFPGKHDTSHYSFVKQLIDSFAKAGNECHVVAPYNVLHYRKLIPYKEHYQVNKGLVTVYRPKYLSFSGVKILQRVAFASKQYALRKALKQLPNRIDVVYSHFWSSGYDGFQYARTRGIPLFVATGESDIKRMFSAPTDIYQLRSYVKGVICVSSKNRDESIKLGLTTADKCGIFPNAVNTNQFKKGDKILCRKKLGLPPDVFIVAFVGWFNERKGSKRVSAAIDMLENVNSIFIGKGNQAPNCKGILFMGYLPHEDVPVYLNAADCFVLPTMAEGCCNAVVEAMACGLPIISSNLSFNWDVLDESNSILVDPTNIVEIAQAIKTLRDDEKKRDALSEGALKRAESLTMECRANAIIGFIKNKMSKK